MEWSFSAWRIFRDRACEANWLSSSVVLWFCSRILILEASSYTHKYKDETDSIKDHKSHIPVL